MDVLGRLETVSIKKVWKLETDFSAWLAQEENLKCLGEVVGIDILEGEAEYGVGDFRADILAQEDGSERRIVIETQYGATDHKHLGQVVTYAAGANADILIWVVEDARDEHRAAIQWLNEHTSEKIAIFLVKIEVFKIGNSAPAPNFSVLERPNNWLKTTRKAEGESEATQRRHQRRYEWWSSLINYVSSSQKYGRLLTRKTPSRDHWMDVGIGSSKYHACMCFKRDCITVGIYIPKDKELFNHFYAQKDEIEAELGFKMVWEPLESKQASRIDAICEVDTASIKNREEYFKWYCEHLKAIKEVFPKYA